MKKLISTLLIIIMLFAAIPFSAFNVVAETYTDDQGVIYTLSPDGTYYEVTDCDESVTTVIIPADINGISAISIGDSAFFDCTSLTSITIPDSVTSIGYSAFAQCTSLTSITIPDSVTSIGEAAFLYCTGLTSVTIPNSVTNIGNSAFYNCTSLISITIPDSVTTIEYDAFSDCVSLTSITIPDSVTYIGMNPFGGCVSIEEIIVESGNEAYYSENNCLIEKSTATLISGCKNSVIPNTVVKIEYGAFRGCRNLISITIPDSVAIIGDSAFEDCISLTSIEIPDTVEMIGQNSFYYCLSLASITIPDSVTTIESSTFGNCRSLASVEIPNSVTTIGFQAFFNCTKLTSIEIPNSVTEIHDQSFAMCSLLEEIIVDNGNEAYYSENNCLIEKSTDILILGCKNSVIPNTVKIIGGHAFHGCENLINIEIPNSVTTIDEWAFFDCLGLKSIVIPHSVTIINNWAFYFCKSLKSIEIPNSVTTIGYGTFSNCINLTDIYCQTESKPEGWDSSWISGCNATVHWGMTAPDVNTPEETYTDDQGVTYTLSGDSTYYIVTDCDQSVTDIVIPSKINGISVQEIGYYAFSFCSSLTSIEIPNSVTIIGEGSFYKCQSLTSIEIPNFVTTIGGHAFHDCRGLTSIKIPNSVTTIGLDAFYDCTSLMSVDIPNSVTTIGEYAFEYCPSLTNIEIPNSVTTIGIFAFSDCVNLKDIYCQAESQPKGWSSRWIERCNATVHWGMTAPVVNIPEATFTDEQGVTYTLSDDGTHYIVTSFDDSVTEVTILAEHNGVSVKVIGEGAFASKLIINIVIPDSIEIIADQAFVECRKLTNITIPDSVTSIGDGAFEGCPSLESITVEDDNITYHSKNNCLIETTTKILIVGCKNSIIPDDGSVETIKRGAFFYCTDLTKVEIPDSVTTIEYFAFAFCTNLTDIIIPKSVTKIDQALFYDSLNLTDIYCEAESQPEGWDTGWLAGCNATVHWGYGAECSHNYSSVVTPPTCTEEGYTTYTCENCGDSYVDDYAGATGHDMGEWKTITEATAEKDGKERADCNNCDYYDTRTVEFVPDASEPEREVIYDYDEELKVDVTVDADDAFEGGTVITVTPTEIGNYQGTILDLFKDINSILITATKDGKIVLPTDLFDITIALPEDHGEDVSIFYVDEDGNISEIDTVIDSNNREISFTTDKTGEFVIVDNSKKSILGDVNRNGKIDMTDYILLKRAYFGTYTFDAEQNNLGDINRNNKIDMTDYILLKRVYFGTYTIK